MLEKILNLIKKIIPKKLFAFSQPAYHYLLALLGAIIYRFPSRQIKVIGVTGTKGKTSTTEILAKILETAGFKVASTSTLQFKIGEKIQRNLYKMSMPGRMFMQKFLRRAVSDKCDYAILEMTSEGSKMFRHKFINLDGLIFTNISPEHIESHGSYQKYLEAKLEYARAMESSPKKNKVLVVNGDDKEAEKFLQLAPSTRQITFDSREALAYAPFTSLPGNFNLLNISAGAKIAEALGVSQEIIRLALTEIKTIPGRMEKIITNETTQNFDVFVDYAHTADSLAKAYEALGDKRKICVLGGCGGGRDKWKRQQMGQVTDKYCDQIILTNEDPYDENPEQIINEVAQGIAKPYKKIIDRREAINSALQIAQELTQADASNKIAVIITGKGTDPYIMGPNGQKTPWDDREVVKEELEKVHPV